MSTILSTIRWLSIITGALSLFYLGHAWFEFGLGEVFTRVYAWYAGILHPAVELLKPVAVWFVELLGSSLPAWWKDATVLTVTTIGASFRAGYWAGRRERRDGIAVGVFENFLRIPVELGRIAVGAFIFAGLNAGLG
jgi:hypothetical protein